METIEKRGKGRPKGDKTVLINFRANEQTVLDAKAKHGKGLNKLFNKWLTRLARKIEQG
jgi:hypothetical protein